MDGLTLRSNFGPDFTNVSEGCYNDPWTHGPCANPGANSQNQGAPPQAFQRNAYDFSYTLDNLLQLDRNIGSKQHIQATALYSIQHDRANRDSLYASNLPYNTQLWYDLGSGTAGQQLSNYVRVGTAVVHGPRELHVVRSLHAERRGPCGRLEPTGARTQVGVLPLGRSARGSSVTSRSCKRFSAINSLKLRAQLRHAPATPRSTRTRREGLLTPRVYTFGSAAVRGYRPGAIPNPDLGWEKTDQTDIGLEFGILGNRISGTIDAYRSNTHDLLLQQALPVSSGFTSTLQNVGSTRNTGLELGLSTVNLDNWHGLRWSTDVNWNKQRNEIVSLQSGTQQNLLNIWFVGSPINLCIPNGPCDPQHQVFYDYKSQGVWQYADTVLMKQFNSTGSTFKVGQPRVADLNGDGKIDANDRSIIGTSYPKWTASLSNRVSYRGFDLAALVTVKWKYTFIDGTPRGMNGRNGNIVMDYWTPENPTNANPAPQAPNSGNAWQYQNTLLYTDGSHWRIRNVTLGYSSSGKLVNRIGASSLRVYAHGAGSVHPHELRRERPRSRRCRANGAHAAHRHEPRLVVRHPPQETTFP